MTSSSRRSSAGRTVYDILMAHTDPKNVAFQLDLYWAANGGGIGNPLDGD